ncbi:MAG: uracil-DNA glycosylase [Brevefilum sp.]
MFDSLTTIEAQLIACRRCPRLVAWREEVAQTKRKAYQNETYWGKPVPGFGDPKAKILIVGLAPGAHGSNRTGRMFTGDASGDFLFPALHRAGFANQPAADHLGDGLKLKDVFITAICRCVPPKNRPLVAEIKNCLPWMEAEIDLLENLQGFVALGQIAFDVIRRMYRMQGTSLSKMHFGHNEFYELGEDLPWLLASYHPSQQNTSTGRLTKEMFDEVWEGAGDLIRY